MSTAALLIIGNEILSGRTQDANLSYLAQKLTAQGIDLCEVRVVRDVVGEIVDALNALRTRYTYVFTTGGIGPTHDDITYESIAVAFGVPCEIHAGARAELLAHYGSEDQLTPARLRMATLPRGAEIIPNIVSGAPGAVIGNVYIMAGVPRIMQAMLSSILPTLTGGVPTQSITIRVHFAESKIAPALTVIQAQYADVDIGSYPQYKEGVPLVMVVARSKDTERLESAAAELMTALEDLGAQPERVSS